MARRSTDIRRFPFWTKSDVPMMVRTASPLRGINIRPPPFNPAVPPCSFTPIHNIPPSHLSQQRSHYGRRSETRYRCCRSAPGEHHESVRLHFGRHVLIVESRLDASAAPAQKSHQHTESCKHNKASRIRGGGAGKVRLFTYHDKPSLTAVYLGLLHGHRRLLPLLRVLRRVLRLHRRHHL